MSETKTVDIGALLSVTGDKMLADIDEIRALLSFMVGEPLHTHQLPLAADAVTPDLLEQHPWLRDVVVPRELTGEQACRSWLAEAGREFGPMHEVTANPLAWGEHDPIADYRNLGGRAEIIAIVAPDES